MEKSLLFVIGRGNGPRYEMARQLFAARSDAEILYDRRMGDRRGTHAAGPGVEERRRSERRTWDITPDLSVKGWAYVRHSDDPGLWLPPPAKVLDTPRYDYYRGASSPPTVTRRNQAARLSREILEAGLDDPDFLVLRQRRRVFSRFVENLPRAGLRVLDVGGRLQPYRPLLEARLGCYVAVDASLEGLMNVVAVGEALPFAAEQFDLVICTQVLNYATNPCQMIAEIHRVLRLGGALFLSVPAIFPRYANQRWRFMPEGLMVLLSAFSFYEIVPEGHSIAGMCRLVNLFLETFLLDTIPWSRARRLVAAGVFPAVNLVGVALDAASRGHSRLTTNYSCLALK